MLANQRPRTRLRFSQSKDRTLIGDRMIQLAARIQMLSHQFSEPSFHFLYYMLINIFIPKLFSLSYSYLALSQLFYMTGVNRLIIGKATLV